jgi:fructose-1,6-bisphosphatase/inositol monophosphatase family enzyme
VYNPVTDLLFSAQKWMWAYKNWQKINVNNNENINKSTVSYLHEYRSVPQTVKHNIMWDLIKINLKRFLVERSPSNDFCLLADWKIEWIICNHESIYDFCAWKLIAKEAWAILTDIQEDKTDTNNCFIISNSSEKLHKQLYDIFTENTKHY